MLHPKTKVVSIKEFCGADTYPQMLTDTLKANPLLVYNEYK